MPLLNTDSPKDMLHEPYTGSNSLYKFILAQKIDSPEQHHNVIQDDVSENEKSDVEEYYSSTEKSFKYENIDDFINDLND